MKKRNFKFLMILLVFIVSYQLSAIRYQLFAQDNNKLVSLSKKVIEVKANEDAYSILQELTELYFKEHKYNECIAYLKSLVNRKKTLEPMLNYYIGFTRYYELRYLEEAKGWDEYFNQGNNYRDEITGSLQKTINAVASTDALGVYARLTLWEFHKGQNDASSDAALSDLMDFVLSYAKEAKNLSAIKAAAAELLTYGEKTKSSQLYKIYVDKIATLQMKDAELKTAALGFYNEGNLDLAEGIYDVYIDRVKAALSKEKFIPILTEIAKIFIYKDQGLNDALYAEKMFQKIEEIGTKNAFDEELIYLRAFNLEKAREYQKAKDFYLDLVQRYPQGVHADKAYFKLGIIYTYILRDLKTGRGYFEKLALRPSLGLTVSAAGPSVPAVAAGNKSDSAESPAQEKAFSPQAISGLYQLGLLSQWQGDLTAAKEYYNKLLERALDSFPETKSLTGERLKEIEEARPIEYNLKTFLDASLKEEYAHLDMTKINLKSHPYSAKKKEIINVDSVAYTADSGCLEVGLQYLWSGHLGQIESSPHDSRFNTTYAEAGSKEINLVVVSSTGIIERSIDLVDLD
jgi:TolA-binding protein